MLLRKPALTLSPFACCPQASHLLKYDSTLGTFNADVKIVDDNTLSVDGKNIRIVSSRDPLQLPWKELGIDIVIEGTGVFVDSKGAGKHIEVPTGSPHSAQPQTDPLTGSLMRGSRSTCLRSTATVRLCTLHLNTPVLAKSLTESVSG